MRPIPRFLLPHSAELVGKTSDGWGGTASESITELKYIRIEPCRSVKFSMGGDIPEIKARLFYDCMNSLPAGTEFAVGETVRFGGRDYAVQEVKDFYDSGRLHHKEVMLS